MPSMTTLVNGTVPVAEDFNGNFSALNAAIGTNTSISAWALGEIPYASAANTLSRLAPGTPGQVLNITGAGIPGWGNVALTDQLTGLALSNNGVDPTNDIDIAVGACASDDAAIASRIFMSLTSGLTKQLDAAWAVGTGAGMRDTGSIADGTWHIFLIERVDTAVVDVLASTSATSPTMPTSYTRKRRIGSILRESGSIVAFSQDGDEFLRSVPILDVNATNPGTSAVTRTLSVPTGVKVRAQINVYTIAGTSADVFAYISPLDSTDAQASATAAPLMSISAADSGDTNNNETAGSLTVRTNTSAQVRSRLSASGASDVLRIATLGWIDRRGKG